GEPVRGLRDPADLDGQAARERLSGGAEARAAAPAVHARAGDERARAVVARAGFEDRRGEPLDRHRAEPPASRAVAELARRVVAPASQLTGRRGAGVVGARRDRRRRVSRESPARAQREQEQYEYTCLQPIPLRISL